MLSQHEQLKRLDAEGAAPETVQPVTKALVAQEDRIQDFYDRVEQYLTGRGKGAENPPPPKEKPSGRYTKESIDAMTDPVFAALCKEKRIEANLKYLKREDISKPMEKGLRQRELEEWGINTAP
jgi:hypothetical protein